MTPAREEHAEFSASAETTPESSPGRIWQATLTASLSFLLLLCSYYILRPVRDEMAVLTGADKLPWLFTGTFLCTIAFVPLFGWIVKRFPKQLLVPLTYSLMIACLSGFFLAFAAGINTLSAAAFFIWLSMFNLMIVSLFWSSVSDAFTTGQAERSYGYISAGGTLGAILGPTTTAILAERVHTSTLLLISGALLTASGGGLMLLRRLSTRDSSAIQRPIGGSILAGVTETAGNPTLRKLAGIAMCYSAVSTMLYLEMTDLARSAIPDSGQRTAYFARIDLGVNLLALLVQVLLTRLIIQRAGVVWALILAPLMMTGCLLVLNQWPIISVLAVVQIIHRACEYAVSKPGREVLYTTVDAESRYKAKNFIDTAVYRTNDTVSSWVLAGIRSIGWNPILLVALPVTVAWGFLGSRLGRRFENQAERPAG